MRKVKQEIINFQLPASQKQRIEARARKYGMSVSSLLRVLIGRELVVGDKHEI